MPTVPDRRSTPNGAGLILLLLALLLPRRLHAEPPRAEARPTQPRAPLVTVWIGSDERRRTGHPYSVVLEPIDPGPGSRIIECETPCIEDIPEGRYNVVVQQTEDYPKTERVVTLDRAGSVVVSTESTPVRTIGLVLGIVGPALIEL
jgi:hypothetical protein